MHLAYSSPNYRTLPEAHTDFPFSVRSDALMLLVLIIAVGAVIALLVRLRRRKG